MLLRRSYIFFNQEYQEVMANGVILSYVHTRKLCLVHFFITYDFNLPCKRELERKDLFKANFYSNFNSACPRYSIGGLLREGDRQRELRPYWVKILPH